MPDVPQTEPDHLSLLIEHGAGTSGWFVWISLPNHDPDKDAYGFIIGAGDTRDAAVTDAVSALQDAMDRLQSPRGQIQEREE